MSAHRNYLSRFYILDLSRGLAAIGIVAYHLSGKTKPLNSLYVLVDFFFVLSGFVLYEQIPKTTSFSELKVFTKKRINRLVPTAWFAIVISYLAYSIFWILNFISPQEKLEINAETFISALLFLQFLIPSSAVLLVPMWSLSVELFVNLLFALMGVTQKKLVLIVSISFVMVFFAVYNSSAVNVTSGWIAFSRGIFGFSCGLIARILHNKKISKSRFQMVMSLLIVGLVFLLVAWSNVYLVLVAPSMSFLVYVFSNIGVHSSRLKSFTIFCGDFSYGIYLWHFPINYFIRMHLPSIISHDSFLLFKIIEFLITLSLALVLTWISLFIFKKVKLFKI